ncbi:Stf0 family sulfotransferase [Alkalihalobacillus trypoxylicola]|uniref:Stf0 family sulfotransferase n=1 Tax=Alkalihalobacillus trypoxylicola TaxID=519424 RepID=UPI001F2FFB96|nr:Stf0 family sulfotransferase [Alkalihalobacillus trypoxylicola]
MRSLKKPLKSYTIWFSQRTGSTLLTKALTSTGIAGNPAELLHFRNPNNITQDGIEKIWEEGTTSNGVFGLKTDLNRKWITSLREFYKLPIEMTEAEVWSSAFPNCQHIWMTRRNKVRLAVSWWRAIVSGEWHRKHGEKPKDVDLIEEYNFNAIHHLFIESTMFEASIEEFFTEAKVVPLTIVYEDFIRDYEGTVLKVLKFLNLPTQNIDISPPYFEQIADDVSEQWVQRYREECQKGWEHIRW